MIMIRLISHLFLLVLLFPVSTSKNDDGTVPSISTPSVSAPIDDTHTVSENTDDTHTKPESPQPITPAVTSSPADATVTSQTKTPTSPSNSPVITPAKAQTTPRPSNSPTTTTTEPTEPPTTPTKPPTISTESPTISTESPTISTESPTISTESPTISTEPPTILTESPTILTESPTISTESPTVSTESPTTLEPLKATVTPTTPTNLPTTLMPSKPPTDAPISQTEVPTPLSDAPTSAPSLLKQVPASSTKQTQHLAYASITLNLRSLASKMNTKYAAIFSSYLDQCLLTYLPSFQASESSSQYSLSQINATVKEQHFSSGARRSLGTNSTSKLGLLAVSLTVEAEYRLLDDVPILVNSDPMAPSNADFAAALNVFFDDDNGGTILIHDYLKRKDHLSYFENVHHVERHDPDRTGDSSETSTASGQNLSDNADNISSKRKSRTIALICMVGAFWLALLALAVTTRILKERPQKITGLKWKGLNNAGSIDKNSVGTLNHQSQGSPVKNFMSSQHSLSSIQSGSDDASNFSKSTVNGAPSENGSVVEPDNPARHPRAPTSVRTPMPSILGYFPASLAQTFAGLHSGKTSDDNTTLSENYDINGSCKGRGW